MNKVLETDEQLAQGVSREWLYDGEVVVLTLTDISRQSVDAYVDGIIEIVNSWPVDKILYSMHDLSGDKLVVSPYFRRRTQEAMDAMREHHVRGCVAVVLPNSFLHRAFGTLAQLFSRQTSLITQEIFHDCELGFRWLEEQMAANVE